MKLILHIGTEKTGSTTIQEYLYQNRELLQENGYYIPKSLGLKNHRKIPSYCMREKRFDNFHYDNSINTIEDKKNFKREVEKELISEFSNLPQNIHTVIISSEHFHSRLIFQNEVSRVKDIFMQFFDSFKILVYLRRQVDLSVSLYSTFLKGGTGSVDVNEFVKKRCKPENHYYNYKKFLSLWENTFGMDAMDVRLFAKEKLYQKDLLLDFTNAVTKKLPENFLLKVIIPNTKNESLNSFGQDIIKIVNRNIPRYLENREPNTTFIKLRSVIVNKCSGKGSQPNYDTAKSIMEKFTESNRVIQKKYFPDHKLLFEESLKKFDTKEERIPNYQEKVFESLIQMIANTSIDTVDINTLRDFAISLEKTDLEKAYNLMGIVNKLCPNRPLITTKLEEYKIFLS